MTQDYCGKVTRYFGNARTEISTLLAPAVECVLEVGCGTGQTMRWLKQTGRVRRACGIEVFESAGDAARAHFDQLIIGDAEELIERAFDSTQFDLILCLDVLEHMVDPWQFVERLQRRLARGGKLVVSVPTVRCARVLVPLAFLGRWRYRDEGILDRTHLRFFTRESALELVAGTHLRIERCLAYRPPRSRLARLHLMTLGLLPGFTAKQYLIAASPRENAAARLAI